MTDVFEHFGVFCLPVVPFLVPPYEGARKNCAVFGPRRPVDGKFKGIKFSYHHPVFLCKTAIAVRIGAGSVPFADIPQLHKYKHEHTNLNMNLHNPFVTRPKRITKQAKEVVGPVFGAAWQIKVVSCNRIALCES